MSTDRALATEERDLETALAQLPDADAFIGRLVARFSPFIPLHPGATILDIGTAQGVISAAYARAGFTVCGVEPWRPALETSAELAARVGVQFDIREAPGEHLPFEDDSADLVHCYSVLEHVDDPFQVFREAYRVLRPGGGLFFYTTSVLSPRQSEILHFPAFPWYPTRVQRAIMSWAVDHKPEIIGGTSRPAIHWFRQRQTQLALRAIGFSRIVNKFEFRAASGEYHGARQQVMRAAAVNRVVRLAGEIATGYTEYLAIK
jgi:2-polyprenyl-3-methyl-5-hydroxy-6-metoxy-1,4-benzoquinol methylase